jgi:hypothetical protein
MRDIFELCTTTPHDEKCAQTGNPNYHKMGRLEAVALKNQLMRMHGNPPGGAYFKITSNPHDFGTYFDLAVAYNEDDEDETDYMLKIESGIPDNWDEEALKELAEGGYDITEPEEEEN